MILRFFCRGGAAALTVLVFAADLLVNSGWLPGAILVPIVVAATFLLRRSYAWPPRALLRDIDKALPGEHFRVLLNKQAGVRFMAARTKRTFGPRELLVGRFTDRDLNESYSDANLGASVTTVPVEVFLILGGVMATRTFRPLVATFKPSENGMIISLTAPPTAARPASRRATARAVVNQLRFRISSGVGHVTDGEIAELAGQLRGASIDPHIV